MRDAKDKEYHDRLSERTVIRHQRFVIVGTVVSLLVSMGVWIMYLFFYNPHTGALPVLGCIPSGIVGIIFSLFLQNKIWRWGMVGLNSLIICSIPLVFYVAFIGGF